MDNATEPGSAPHLIRHFGTLQAIALNMSNMIGIGPFLTIPLLMSALGGPQALLGWLVALLIVIPDGMVWSELGAAMPGSGGSYVYLREGFGREIAMGSRLLTQKYGHPELSMSVKGQEFAAYDGRAMQGMGLGYATSNRGACHLRASPYASDFETTDPEVKPRVCKTSQDEIAAIDSSGLCLFVGDSGLPFGRLAEHIDAACPGRWTQDDLRLIGERIWNMERLFNLKSGLSAADDTLPPRMLREPAPSGTGKGLVSRLDLMLPAYYRERGWDDSGVPRTETLARLRL